MTATPGPQPGPDRHYAGLLSMGLLGEEAGRHLLELDAQLVRAGKPLEAKRLRKVGGMASARTIPFPALEQQAAPDLLIEALSARKRGRARTWMGIRNAAALLPLLATWFFLAWSAFEYQRELAADPAKINIPFLLLWEQRFDGSPIPSFSATAVITGVLLLVVLGLTLLAQRLETGALRAETRGAALVDTSMNALQAAVEQGAHSAPVSARDWAVAAQQILTDTQRAIADSTVQTRNLVVLNREIKEDAQAFITTFSAESLSTLKGIRDENKQFIDRTSKAAVDVLERALASNRALIAGELTPLVQDFRATLEDFVRHHETYRDSARLLADSSSSMDRSAQVLAASATSYTTIASSIDDHLRILEGTQQEFINRVTSSADSMRSASDTMLKVSTALSDDVKKQIEELVRNVVQASADVVSIHKELVASSTAMKRVTRTLDSGVVPSLDGLVGAMKTAAEELRTAHKTKWWWQR